MPDAVALRGRRLLVVEDEYVIAAELAASLKALGVEVAGPAASVAEALTLLENDGGRLDGAVLDINLGNERVYPVADVLRGRGIPFRLHDGLRRCCCPGLLLGGPAMRETSRRTTIGPLPVGCDTAE